MQTIGLDQDPACKQPTTSTKREISTIIINIFTPHSKLFSETEGFRIDGASFIEVKFFDTPVLKVQTQLTLLFPFHRAPESFSLPFERVELSRYT